MSRIRKLVGCRKAQVLAGTLASAVMIGMSTSGALAVVGCAGTAGTSAVTSNATQLNLQCMQPIFIPGHPLQSFGGSELVRTNGTTAFYYLADRTNLGIDVVNATNMTYTRRLVPPAGAGTAILNSIGAITGYRGQDPTGGFLGATIYTAGPCEHRYGKTGHRRGGSIPAPMGRRSMSIPMTKPTTSAGLSSPMVAASLTTTAAVIRALRPAGAIVPAGSQRIPPSPGPSSQRAAIRLIARIPIFRLRQP